MILLMNDEKLNNPLSVPPNRVATARGAPRSNRGAGATNAEERLLDSLLLLHVKVEVQTHSCTKYSIQIYVSPRANPGHPSPLAKLSILHHLE